MGNYNNSNGTIAPSFKIGTRGLLLRSGEIVTGLDDVKEYRRLSVTDTRSKQSHDVAYYDLDIPNYYINSWKENVEDDPEAVFDSVEQWEKHKADPEARITVTAFKKIEHPVMKAEDILDDIITNMEENDRCFQDNTYRSNKTLLEAAQKFKEVVEKEVDPYYYGAFDVLCWLNKPNKGI